MQISYLREQREEQHNNHIMNSRAVNFFIVPPPSTMEVILFNLMDVLFEFSDTDHFSKLDKRLLCDFHHPPQYMFLPARMKRLEYLRWDLK